MSGHTIPWTHHHHQGQPVVRNLGQVFRQPPPPPTPPTWTAPATTRSPLGHPQAGTVHVGPHAHHDTRPGHHHLDGLNRMTGQDLRPGYTGGPQQHWQFPDLYQDGRHQGPGYHDPRIVYTPGPRRMHGFCVTPEVIPASPHDVMTQQHKINQALELVRAHKVPMLSGHDLLSVASQRRQELMQILAQSTQFLSVNMYADVIKFAHLQHHVFMIV